MKLKLCTLACLGALVASSSVLAANENHQYCLVISAGAKATAEARDKGLPRGQAALSTLKDKSGADQLKKELGEMEDYAFKNPQMKPDTVQMMSYYSCRLNISGALNGEVSQTLDVALLGCQEKSPDTQSFTECASSRVKEILATRPVPTFSEENQLFAVLL